MPLQREALALRLKELLEEVSPLIEGYTSEVCPRCRDVCCRQRHASYEEDDLRYISALGLPLQGAAGRDPDEPCEHLSDRGCRRPRWLRPFRCTWYFCEQLLERMTEDAGRPYRRVVGLLREAMELRRRLSGGPVEGR